MTSGNSLAGTGSTTTLMVTDTVNNYTRRIPLIIGTGIPSLSNLVLGGIQLSPGFTPGQTSYSASVSNTKTSVKLYPRTLIGSATIKVNGVTTKSGEASPAIPLAVGKTTIQIVITPQSSTASRTYKVTVTRAASAVSTLSKLVLKGARLAPGFKAARRTYEAKVASTTKSIKVVPTATSGLARIKLNGVTVKSKRSSKAIPLKYGRNLLSLVVTAQNGAKRTYKIIVIRAPKKDSRLRPPTTSLAAFALERSGGLAVGKAEAVPSVMKIGELKFLTMAVRKPAGPTTAIPRIEVSGNLVDWCSGRAHTTVLEDNPWFLRVRDNIPLTDDSKRFIRMKNAVKHQGDP